MKRLLKVFAMFLIFSLTVAAIGLGVARATLPNSACAVSQDQTNAIKLEISHADVVAAFGCDGVVVSHSKLGDYTFETRAWRGTAWPYGFFKGEFIDGELHGTEVRWINLNLTLNDL